MLAKAVYLIKKYSKNSNIILVIKAEFSASLLQSSVSRDPSEIILIF